jgi:hypothetical protein
MPKYWNQKRCLLLGNGSVNTFPQQQIRKQPYRYCWKQRFVFGPCKVIPRNTVAFVSVAAGTRLLSSCLETMFSLRSVQSYSQKYLYYCIRIRRRGNIFTELLFRNGSDIFISVSLHSNGATRSNRYTKSAWWTIQVPWGVVNTAYRWVIPKNPVQEMMFNTFRKNNHCSVVLQKCKRNNLPPDSIGEGLFDI